MNEESTIVPDMRTREARAAQAYMQHKGYGDLRPHEVIKIEGSPCWYFYYRIPPDRLLELEVCWSDEGTSSVRKGSWNYSTMVSVQSGLVYADT